MPPHGMPGMPPAGYPHPMGYGMPGYPGYPPHGMPGHPPPSGHPGHGAPSAPQRRRSPQPNRAQQQQEDKRKKAREEQEDKKRKAKEEVERIKKEEAERKAKEEAERKAKLEAEQAARRREMISVVFKLLDKENKDELDEKQMRRIGRHAGFKGNDEAWAQDFKFLCASRKKEEDKEAPTVVDLDTVVMFLSYGDHKITDIEIQMMKAKLEVEEGKVPPLALPSMLPGVPNIFQQSAGFRPPGLGGGMRPPGNIVLPPKYGMLPPQILVPPVGRGPRIVAPRNNIAGLPGVVPQIFGGAGSVFGLPEEALAGSMPKAGGVPGVGLAATFFSKASMPAPGAATTPPVGLAMSAAFSKASNLPPAATTPAPAPAAVDLSIDAPKESTAAAPPDSSAAAGKDKPAASVTEVISIDN